MNIENAYADCPVCDGTGERPGKRTNRFYPDYEDDVMLVCPACRGRCEVTEEEWLVICGDYGLCILCGEEDYNEECSRCLDDMRADEAYHRAVDDAACGEEEWT